MLYGAEVAVCPDMQKKAHKVWAECTIVEC